MKSTKVAVLRDYKNSITDTLSLTPTEVAPSALIIEGAAEWDYDLTPTENRFVVSDSWYTCQINDDDPDSPNWRTELYVPNGAGNFVYNTPYRIDWQVQVDEDWPIGTADNDMLIAQLITTNNPAVYNGPTLGLYIGKGSFHIKTQYADGSPPAGTYETFGWFPVRQGTYDLSLRFKNHLSTGWMEFWVDRQCIAARTNFAFGPETFDVAFKYGMYRWEAFSGSISVKVSKTLVLYK